MRLLACPVCKQTPAFMRAPGEYLGRCDDYGDLWMPRGWHWTHIHADSIPPMWMCGFGRTLREAQADWNRRIGDHGKERR